jgi:hypothetical protein
VEDELMRRETCRVTRERDWKAGRRAQKTGSGERSESNWGQDRGLCCQWSRAAESGEGEGEKGEKGEGRRERRERRGKKYRRESERGRPQIFLSLFVPLV